MPLLQDVTKEGCSKEGATSYVAHGGKAVLLGGSSTEIK